MSRLSTVNYGDGETQSYGFDPMGNRTAKSDTTSGVGGGTTNEYYGFDAANRLRSHTVSGATSTVMPDANGNTLTDGLHLFLSRFSQKYFCWAGSC